MHIEGRRFRRRSGGAFSLTELLVVIAVIGILAALLLPNLADSRRKAIRISCLSNEKNQAAAFLMYADDYSGWFPTADQTTRYNLDCLYVMSTNQALALVSYGLASSRFNTGDEPLDEKPTTCWRCPALNNWPRFFSDYDGLFKIDHYMLLTGLSGDRFKGRYSPARNTDRMGPLTADHTLVFLEATDTEPAQEWRSNHETRLRVPDGHNESFSDGHGEWMSRKRFVFSGTPPNPYPDPLWVASWPWSWTWVEPQ